MIDLKRAILAALGKKPAPRMLDSIAEQLETEAAELRRRAEALREDARRPPAERLSRQIKPRSPQAGPGANPGDGVRWNGRQIIIGRALWYAIGSPKRIGFSFSGAYTEIRAGDEYAIIVKDGQAPRASCRRACEIGQWAEGWRTGEVAGSAIRFRADATED